MILSGIGTRHDRIVAALRRHGAYPTVLRICDRAGLELADVLGTRRLPALVRARHEAWSVVHHTLAQSYPETAALFGIVSHQSVMYALKKRERALFSHKYPTCSPVKGAGVRANVASSVADCHATGSEMA